jgi:hypothetical protein
MNGAEPLPQRVGGWGLPLLLLLLLQDGVLGALVPGAAPPVAMVGLLPV